MMKKTSIITALAAVLIAGTAHAATAPKAPSQEWGFHGPFGTFDRGALQRGFQVFKEVCNACHGLDMIAYRNLQEIGFTPEQVEEIASEYEIEDINPDDGERFFREAIAADRFNNPFPNKFAAQAANGGAYPPDLSLITKARIGGPDYLYALMVGYKDEPPEGVELLDGLYYNDYFPGHQIAMAPPLTEEAVEYADGTEPTLEQHARDLVEFLHWAAQPELEERKRLGIKVLIFTIVLTAMMYALKRKIWADLH